MLSLRLDDLFVNNPVKQTPVVEEIEISGSFSCQNCDHESENAKIREGKIWWICTECNYRSVVNGFG